MFNGGHFLPGQHAATCARSPGPAPLGSARPDGAGGDFTRMGNSSGHGAPLPLPQARPDAPFSPPSPGSEATAPSPRLSQAGRKTDDAAVSEEMKFSTLGHPGFLGTCPG